MTAPRLTEEKIRRAIRLAHEAGALRVVLRSAEGEVLEFDLRAQTAEPPDEFDLVDMRR